VAHDGTDSVRVHGLNNTWPGRTAPNWTGLPSQSADSSLDADWNDPADRRPLIIRWTGWRLRLLVLCALLGCVATAMLVRALIAAPHIDASWRADSQGRIELAASADPALQPYVGHALLGIAGGDVSVALIDALALQRSPRWVIGDGARARQQLVRDQLTEALHSVGQTRDGD